MKRKRSESGFRTYGEYLQAVSGPPEDGIREDETPEEYGRRLAREAILGAEEGSMLIRLTPNADRRF